MVGLIRKLSLLFLLLVSGCSSTTFFYNRLDIILPWYLDDYVELNSLQEEKLDQLLDPFLYWHRVEELPRYLELLRELESDLQAPLTAEDVGRILDQFETAFGRLESESLGLILELAEGLEDEQIEQFLAVLQEQQDEYEDKYLSRSETEFRRDNYDNLEEGMKQFLGRLNREQKQQLAQASDAMVRMDTEWLQERAAWQARLAQILQRRSGWQQRLRQAISTRDRDALEGYQAKYQFNLDIIGTLTAELLNSRTAKQDRRLQRKLSSLQRDLNKLIEQAGQVTATATG